MKKILVPSDFSSTAENAFQYARAFAAEHQGSIQLLNVAQPKYEAVDISIPSQSTNNLLYDAARNRLNSFLEQCMEDSGSVAQAVKSQDILTNVEIGFPVARIVEVAQRDDIDLIIIGSQGEHSRWDRLLGSVSAGVLEKSKTPVLVIPEHHTYKSVERITVAVDLKRSDPWEIHRAVKLLKTNLRHLDCVHINLTDKEDNTAIQLQELEEFYSSYPQMFSMGFRNIPGASVQATLNKYVEENEMDLLVMLGPHLPALKKFFYKSRSKEMLFQTKVPLLVLN